MKDTVDQQEIAKFANLAEQWWDKDGPLKTLHDINPARLAFIEQYTSLNGLRVLDVGCGGGILSEAMARLGAQVTGLDAEEDSIAAARRHAEQSQLTVRYVSSVIEAYDDDLFDVITCMEMLEHVKHPEEVIRHCARLLKPGGSLFLSTINRTLKAYAAAIVAAEYLLGLLPRQTHDYDKFIKPSELAAMARHAGLEIRGLKGIDYHPFARRSGLKDSVDVNYLLSCFKP
ncbi:bifunctional 2-polyprenyl-6-hydroxyphenol methylase/3-demethylubiquinol 3-O-methyltransferase UbiG [Legionella taurinensis]|uniref:Ubiquinone biosynthesis O-methyltransferase n=1 Tax=Legionella taurinensis TaxID=70611 RepID=A0A3A5L9M4_9GAMM|nr:bifunctional 2-polyprenyl-6-hydroxyphenol methylase/3-demethylubiquinol 3-O-methyltransferase UbiG [Legionella taurinensis]MDX1836923.1 bifunctional 2-polyprenyl-6-hydroxyphenol methylase/3-demethylubiquinol 3-O-methyltransferase UbiG [Legionella taurinensis]PUT41333.1 bifunctional 3-demethylubiquinol 3-O-methyltransferase/2-polyprenyl-6-hydroxyphenol methylase [Legionella taurinensis]PUT42571.1 bifunctional 3-demethylubiquinol 3-O-methyltransferase/2-polyprenyl-6-hydroxyphenol methylase [Leg